MDGDQVGQEVTETVLRCSSCGALVDHLFTARHDVRSLSLHKTVEQGDVLCERCLQELQEELSEEEILRGPA